MRIDIPTGSRPRTRLSFLLDLGTKKEMDQEDPDDNPLATPKPPGKPLVVVLGASMILVTFAWIVGLAWNQFFVEAFHTWFPKRNVTSFGVYAGVVTILALGLGLLLYEYSPTKQTLRAQADAIKDAVQNNSH